MRGDIAKTMLDEYMKSFRERNPNLHVFNAVLHMDEASPHLHIDFVPVYRNSRTRFLSTGVSMRAALIEQGFHANGQQHNQLVAWEASERQVMEAILHRHGYVREDKNAQYMVHYWHYCHCSDTMDNEISETATDQIVGFSICTTHCMSLYLTV